LKNGQDIAYCLYKKKLTNPSINLFHKISRRSDGKDSTQRYQSIIGYFMDTGDQKDAPELSRDTGFHFYGLPYQ
jgi:ribosomal protein RSM22 (predicted rRNA methylase)